MSARPDLVDWGAAIRVGEMVAGPGPAVSAATRAAVRAELAELTTLSDSLVRDFTGLQPTEPPGDPIVLDRAGWIRANIDGFRELLRPLAERVDHVAPVRRRVGSRVLGVQLGLLLGYLSQKVLGQYDLLLAAESGGRVYYVGPNVVGTERRWQLSPRDFRLWIALHEVTHRTQFAATPWLRDHVKGLMSRYLSSIQFDSRAVRDAVARVRKLIENRNWRGANLLTIFLSPDQQDVVAQMQALMTVVEGHGNFVMNRVGALQIGSYERLHRSLSAQRAQVGNVEKVVQRAIGMEMKYQQYSLGEEFVVGVEQRAGMSAVNRVWERVENLPSAEELRDPERWLQRVQ